MTPDGDPLELPQRRMTGALREELHRALLSAFPNPSTFEQMLSFRVDLPMASIAPVSGNYGTVVFEVIEWAEAHGRLEQLISAALADVPGNPELQSFGRKWSALPATTDAEASPAPRRPTPTPIPTSAPTPTPTPTWTSTPPPTRRFGQEQWHLWLVGGVLVLLLAAVGLWILLPVEINGHILYKNSDKTVKGAVVRVPRTGAAGTTDDFGFFKLRGSRTTRHLYVHVDGNQYEVVLIQRVGQRFPIVPSVTDAPKVLTPDQSKTVEQLVKAQPARFRVDRGAGRHGALWPVSTTIRVAFLDGTAELRSLVKRVATEWTKHGNVGFDFDATVDDSDVRVSFKDAGASYSYVGTDALAVPKDKPTLVLGAIADDEAPERESTILHEFGHALGLVHEYATPAGEKRINFPVVYSRAAQDMGWSKSTIDFNLRHSARTPDAYSNKPFDPESVMMSRLPSDWFAPPLQIGARTGLSDGDRALMARLYPVQ